MPKRPHLYKEIVCQRDINCFCCRKDVNEPLTQAVVDEMVKKDIWWQEFYAGEPYGLHCNVCGHSGGWPGWGAETAF